MRPIFIFSPSVRFSQEQIPGLYYPSCWSTSDTIVSQLQSDPQSSQSVSLPPPPSRQLSSQFAIAPTRHREGRGLEMVVVVGEGWDQTEQGGMVGWYRCSTPSPSPPPHTGNMIQGRDHWPFKFSKRFFVQKNWNSNFLNLRGAFFAAEIRSVKRIFFGYL